jgi:regulator of replication initiation timing
MAKEYNVGDRLYLPVWVTEKETNLMMGPDKSTTITDAKFSYAYWHGKTGEGKVRYGEDGLLLTATEIAEKVAGRRCAECYPTYEELKSRNAELEALLKEVMATRDEAIRQNDELITKNNELEDANCNLTKACSEWQIAAQTSADNAKVADRAADELRKENKDLKAKVAENADTISRLSANKVALTEEVGGLRETVADRTKDVQHLTEENDKLTKRNKYLESEKNRKPIVHVLTNDGHVYAFTSSGKVHVKYCTEHNILMIEDGEKTIAGFSRGDKPGNLSAWWMG